MTDAETFAEWLRRQGYRVKRTLSSHWYEAAPHVYQAFPYHWVVEPSEEELIEFLRQNRAIALRYSAPVDSPIGCISYHVVYDKPNYGLDMLDRRSRQNVRTGLRHCSVEPIACQRLAQDGWALECDTVDRQGRRLAQSQAAWCRRCQAAADLAGFEAWGALAEGRLVASLLTFQMDDCCEMISQQCHRDYLAARVNNALTFTVTQAMLSRDQVRSVFYALHSLDAQPSVDQFKFRMGYMAKPVRQRVVFHPWVAPAANRTCYTWTKQLQERYASRSVFTKAEGMLRFYLEGLHPLAEQQWPKCLVEACGDGPGE